jgi:hypothetical protein
MFGLERHTDASYQYYGMVLLPVLARVVSTISWGTLGTRLVLTLLLCDFVISHDM